MTQLILHLFGDFILQSQDMSDNKRKSSLWAAFHATVYSLPFLLLRPSVAAFSVILVTHFFIDRFGLARYIVWVKNIVLGSAWKYAMCDPMRMSVAECYRYSAEWSRWKWSSCKATGYPEDMPVWLATTLLIVADNTLHLAINYAALRWL